MPLQLSPADLLGRVNRDVERSYLRARNGLRYVRGSNRPKLGTTPKDVVWQRDKAQLWRYRGGPVRFAQPLLIVTSLVSRSYILDLLPGSSAVEFLRNRGFDVFMLDWGIPDELDADNSLADVRGRVPPARRGGGAAADRLRGAHDGRLLPRRRALRALRQRSRRPGRAQSRADGDAGRLRGDGPDGRRAARGAARSRGPRSTRAGTCRPTCSTAGSSCSRRPRSWPSGRRCWRTSGTTSSCAASRRWRSGRATRCRSPARRSARWSSCSSGATR